MDRNEVSAAFEIVLEEVETVVDSLNLDGAGAFQKGDYDTARGLIEIATRLTEFRGKVRNLQKEWENLFSARIPRKPSRRKRTSRLDRGLRTPEDAYRRPILETLIELGGSASVGKVLDSVEEKMKASLNTYDRQPLPSAPHTPRWRNNAQWCRNTLVQEGLLKADSPWGMWEISPKGIAATKHGDL
ncbi:MAG: winged helix-turn-helix domain-containing protein [Chloroflexi bacterium]|nr:winged helix-turn-helix domain-containing protein [Chloroflexota bacterium]MBL7061899.1 winged helix-turn-helix domain-containing protein [Dehalococcoidia bacterium]